MYAGSNFLLLAATDGILSVTGLCTAMTDANLTSVASADTAFPRLACSREAQMEQTFESTTSPRLGSRLARRPKAQFPYSMQPFHIMPPPPGDNNGISVSEANRRLRQAQALSERQQHFGQLIDLASTGKDWNRAFSLLDLIMSSPAFPIYARSTIHFCSVISFLSSTFLLSAQLYSSNLHGSRDS